MSPDWAQTCANANTHCGKKYSIDNRQHIWRTCRLINYVVIVCQFVHTRPCSHLQALWKQIASDYVGVLMVILVTVKTVHNCNMISEFFLTDRGDKVLRDWTIHLQIVYLPRFFLLRAGLEGVSLASQTCFSCLCPSTSRRQLKTSLEN